MKFIKKYSMLLKALVFIIYVVGMSFDTYYTFISIQAIANAIAVIGLVIISGMTRQIHLGQAAFVGLGAYSSAIMMTKLGVNFWVSIPVAVIVAALVGVVLGIPTLKLRDGPYLALVTQIFGEVIFILLLNWEGLTGGSFGLSKIPFPEIGPVSFQSKRMLLYLSAVFLMVAFFVAYRIYKSKFGRFFISIRESEAAAQSVGVNTMKYKIIAFTLSSAFAGFAGVLYAQCIGYLNPDQFRWQVSLTLLSMAIIGGISSLEGGVLGAIVLTLLPEFLRGFSAQMRMITYGVLVILVLTLLPDGLISLFGKKPSEIRTMFRERAAMLTDERARQRRKLKARLK